MSKNINITPETRFTTLVDNIIKTWAKNPMNIVLAAMGSCIAKLIFTMNKDPKTQWFNYLQFQKAVITSMRMENVLNQNPDPTKFAGLSEEDVRPSTLIQPSERDLATLRRAQQALDAADVPTEDASGKVKSN